jgi:phage head maturation protease
MEKMLHSTSKVKAINKDGSVKFRLTERKVDRHGEVVMSDGAQLDNYMKNPVVLFSHGFDQNQGMMPIGRIDTDSIKMTSKSIDANVIFDDNSSDGFAKLIAEKVRNGFLNAGSIGFRPIESTEETVLRDQTGITHTKWELMEFSIVPIPALPSATARREFNEFCVKADECGITIDSAFISAINGMLDIHAEDMHIDEKTDSTPTVEFEPHEVEDEYEVEEKRILSVGVLKLKETLFALNEATDVLQNLLSAKNGDKQVLTTKQYLKSHADYQKFMTEFVGLNIKTTLKKLKN